VFASNKLLSRLVQTVPGRQQFSRNLGDR
jgi:hypothetical protein